MTFSTVFKEIKCIVNNNVTTYVGDDVKDLESLTTNHLLLGQYGMDKYLHVNGKYASIRKRWVQIQTIGQYF